MSAMTIRIEEPLPKIKYPLKVAAYCRVSTDYIEQSDSLQCQRQTYRRRIKNTPGWKYAGVFYDVKSARDVERPGLQKLLKKCEQGKVDMIITKSISRFSRNTIDSLTMIRNLTRKDIDIFFETQGIHTLTQRGELLITLFAACAQMESQSLSENVKWGINRSVQLNPDSPLYSRPCYGYSRSEDGTDLEIIEDEAEVVRLIYQLRKDGCGYKKIVKELKMREIPSPEGKPVWQTCTVKRILLNEKYRGESMFYKHFIADYPSKKRICNRGEHVKYIVKEHHKAIITEN